MASKPSRSDPLLLTELGLVLVLIALGIYLFMRPAAEGGAFGEWWHWMVLAGLFFGAVGLHGWRRRHSSHRALHQAIREESEGSPGSV